MSMYQREGGDNDAQESNRLSDDPFSDSKISCSLGKDDDDSLILSQITPSSSGNVTNQLVSIESDSEQPEFDTVDQTKLQQDRASLRHLLNQVLADRRNKKKEDNNNLESIVENVHEDPLKDLEEGIFIFRRAKSLFDLKVPVDEEEYLKNYKLEDE